MGRSVRDDDGPVVAVVPETHRTGLLRLQHPSPRDREIRPVWISSFLPAVGVALLCCSGLRRFAPTSAAKPVVSACVYSSVPGISFTTLVRYTTRTSMCWCSRINLKEKQGGKMCNRKVPDSLPLVASSKRLEHHQINFWRRSDRETARRCVVYTCPKRWCSTMGRVD